MTRAFAGCEEILKENKRSLSGQTSVFGSLKSCSETRTSPLVLWDITDDDPDDSSIFHVPQIIICLSFHIFLYIFLSTNIFFFFLKTDCL